MMADYVLPIPEPDWDNPEPVDAPEPEEVDAYKALVKLCDGLSKWLSKAVGTSLRPVEWRQLIAVLNTATQTCIVNDTDPVATHVFSQIVVHQHAPVPLRDVCVRCALPVSDEVHVHELDHAENNTP